jgi:hypothetical protein
MEIGLQVNAFIGFNNLKYINNELSMAYIQYFDKYIKNKIIGV